MISNIIQYLQKDIVKNFFIYILGAVFLKGIAFFLIPVYTKVLTPEEFGQLELITTITTVLSILISYGLPQLVFIEYIHINREDRFKYINKIITIYFVAATPVFLIFYLILLNFNFFDLKENKFYIISFALLSSYFLFFQTVFFSILQLEKRALTLTKYKVVAGIGIAIFNIVLVYYLRYGIIGILFTNFIILIVSLLIAFPKNIKEKNIALLRTKEIKNDIKHKIIKGFPYILSSLSVWMIAGIDRWIIYFFLGQHQVGLYSVAYKFAVMYEPLLIGPLLGVYSPFIFEKFKNEDFDQKPLLIFLSTILVFSVLALISYLVANIMIDESFKESVVLVPTMVFGYAFILLAQIFGCLMVFQNKSSLLVKNIFISSLINIITNFYFIQRFQLAGATIAFLLSNFVWFSLTFYQNARLKRSIQLPVNA